MRRINEFLKHFPNYNHEQPEAPADNVGQHGTPVDDDIVMGLNRTPTDNERGASDAPGEPTFNEHADEDTVIMDLTDTYLEEDTVMGENDAPEEDVLEPRAESGSNDPPDSPWLQPAWLKQVARYLESVIQQDYPRFSVANGPLPRTPDYLSKQTTYFGADDFDQDCLHEYKSDVYHLTQKCVTHECKEVCTKYGSETCRFNYPRPLVMVTGFKNGVIQLKRLDTRCNNYNRAMMAVLRCNMDVKFITNGQDARATIFYITDYITKSELSAYQSVTLIKLAIDKLDSNLYPRKSYPDQSEAANKARIRIFTTLNVLDANVERSAQWVVQSIMGWPLEYTSHDFCSFNAYSFISFVHSTVQAAKGIAVRERPESATPILPDTEQKDEEVKYCNRRVDYRLRLPAGAIVSRNPTRELQPGYLFCPYPTNQETLAQMSPYEYHFRVQKKAKYPVKNQKDVLGDDQASDLRPEDMIYECKPLECEFHPDHPQFHTHVQVLLDVTNPKVPHLVPTMYGYIVPDEVEDPDKYYLCVVSLFTPYTDPATMIQDERNGESGLFDSYKECFEVYMENISYSDPVHHKWILSLVDNMKTIKEGRHQQKLDRQERERLQQEQELMPSEPMAGYDHSVEEDDESGLGPSDMEAIIRRLPVHGNGVVPKKTVALTDLLSKQLHPSRAINSRDQQKTTYRTAAVDIKQHITLLENEFQELLRTTRDGLYSAQPNSTANVLFTSASTIASEANLDSDQRAAFMLIAKQVLLRTLHRLQITPDAPKQMLMFLGGEGGTGKSKVLKALTKYMATLGVRHRIRLGAQTGVAAGNINGSTLHSLLELEVKKTRKDGKPKGISGKVCSEFECVDIFFHDEVSMSGCGTLQEVSIKLADAKSTKVPFGGVDMIFAGDFYQLPPNTNDALYKAPSVAKNINLTKAGAGFLKFQELTHVIILRHQHRMKDKAYRDMVQRFRHGKSTVEDAKYCTKRKITKDNTLDTGHLSQLPAEPIIIVKNNEPRYHINMVKARQHALASGQKLLFNIARDTSKVPVSNPIRKEILMLHESGATSYSAGILPLFIGMPAMVKKNLGTELGISNGSTGVIHDIVLDPRENVDYSNLTPHYLRYHPVAVYMKLDTPIGKDGKPEKKFQLTGLPQNVFVLSTRSVSKNFPNIVKHEPRGSPVTYTMSRVQFCILPAYAITVNSSQGRTLQSAIINLEGNFKNNVKAYVMLSRLTNGSNFGILGDWHPTLWDLQPCPEMLKHSSSHLLPKERVTRKLLPSLDQSIMDLETTLRLNL